MELEGDKFISVITVVGTSQPRKKVSVHSMMLPIPNHGDLLAHPSRKWLNIFLPDLGVPQTFLNDHECDMIPNLFQMLREWVLQHHQVHLRYCIFIMVFNARCCYNIVNVPYLCLKEVPSWRLVQQMAYEGGRYSLPAGSTLLERLKVKDDEKENCVICLKELNSGDDAARLPCCHVCHYHCILEWFVYNGTCPICRFACTSTAVSNSLAIVAQ